MTAPPWKFADCAQAFRRGWHSFFHAPCDGRVCAAVRIGYASLILIHLAVLYPDLDLWFTDGGLLPTDPSREAASPYAWSLLWMLPGTSAAVHACFWAAAAHALALLVGLLPRVNALFLFVWIISFQNRNQLINDGEDTLLRIIGFFMIWLPSGHCWSVSAAVRKYWQSARGSETADCIVPGWGLRLLQLEMAWMFFCTGWLKLGGEPWLNGTALYYVSRLDDHFGRFAVPAWIFDTPWVVALITWSVMIAELTIPFLLWFRETRLACLAALVIFHLANEWTMNLFLFHWLMLCGWMSFLTPADFAFGRTKSVLPSLQADRSASQKSASCAP